MQQTVHIVVKGKVQGVFYRQSTKEFALQNNITGQVKNLPECSVEIIATGTFEQLRTLEQWCHKGPARAQVTAVEVQSIDLELLDGFSIKR